jgi:hypothetical protein
MSLCNKICAQQNRLDFLKSWSVAVQVPGESLGCPTAMPVMGLPVVAALLPLYGRCPCQNQSPQRLRSMPLPVFALPRLQKTSALFRSDSPVFEPINLRSSFHCCVARRRHCRRFGRGDRLAISLCQGDDIEGSQKEADNEGNLGGGWNIPSLSCGQLNAMDRSGNGNSQFNATDAVTDAFIKAEIERVRSLRPAEIRTLWRKLLKEYAPKALSREFQVRVLAWIIQERALGGHSRDTLKILKSHARGRSALARSIRDLKPGTELVREYEGSRHTVTITAEGFFWRDGVHRSLSSIAREITGTSWNGPRFFGLRADRVESPRNRVTL